jgi:phosphate transporter
VLHSIYRLERNLNQSFSSVQPYTDGEQSPLLSEDQNPDTIFTRALDSELEKICGFYRLKELEIYGEVEELLKDVEAYKAQGNDFVADYDGRPASRAVTSRASAWGRQGSIFRSFGLIRPRRTSVMSVSFDDGMDDYGDSDDDDEAAALTKRQAGGRPRSRTWDQNASTSQQSSRELSTPKRRASIAFEDYPDQDAKVLYDPGVALKKRAIGIYVSLCGLKSFIQLNKTGFSKALKKYDKILDRNLRNSYMEKFVNPAPPFTRDTMAHVEDNISEIEKAYAEVITNGDIALARRELRLHLREHVVWERNTVWREMIGIERKAQAANMGLRRTLLGTDTDPSRARLQGDEEEVGMKEFITPVGKFYLPTWMLSSTMYTLLAIIAIFFIMLYIPILEKPEQQNCLAMLIFVSLLWATEVSQPFPLMSRLP